MPHLPRLCSWEIPRQALVFFLNLYGTMESFRTSAVIVDSVSTDSNI
jgi:hypothetical protein